MDIIKKYYNLEYLYKLIIFFIFIFLYELVVKWYYICYDFFIDEEFLK